MAACCALQTSRDVRLESGMLIKAEVRQPLWIYGFTLARYENSRQRRFIEKWFPGERLTAGIVKMSFLQKLAYASEVFTKE